jgi:hypothetical protein
MLVHTRQIQGGVALWPRRKLESVRIRVAIVPRRQAVSIAALIVRGLATGRRLRATVITRNAAPTRRRVRRDSPRNPSLRFQ